MKNRLGLTRVARQRPGRRAVRWAARLAGRDPQPRPPGPARRGAGSRETGANHGKNQGSRGRNSQESNPTVANCRWMETTRNHRWLASSHCSSDIRHSVALFLPLRITVRRTGARDLYAGRARRGTSFAWPGVGPGHDGPTQLTAHCARNHDKRPDNTQQGGSNGRAESRGARHAFRSGRIV